jgi:hypothetical protein
MPLPYLDCGPTDEKLLNSDSLELLAQSKWNLYVLAFAATTDSAPRSHVHQSALPIDSEIIKQRLSLPLRSDQLTLPWPKAPSEPCRINVHHDAIAWYIRSGVLL